MPIGDITPSSSINSTATEPTVVERMHRLAGGQTKKEKSPGGRAVRTRAQPAANLSSYLGSHSSASRRKGNVGWPSHPVAICTMCSAPIEDPRFINERCTRRVHGRRCKGTYEITMSPRDWKRCSSCSGLGFRGDRRCNPAGEPGGHMSVRKITDNGGLL